MTPIYLLFSAIAVIELPPIVGEREGREREVTVTSRLVGPVVAITNESQYEESWYLFIRRALFGPSPPLSATTPWAPLHNWLVRAFLKGTRQPLLSPPRPLSPLELSEIHERFASSSLSLSLSQFNDLWAWFGKMIQKLRYLRHASSLFERGVISGALSRSEAERELEREGEGASLVRLSTRHAGMFVVSYRAPRIVRERERERGSGVETRHYLITSEDISPKKTLADFLASCDQFSTLGQLTPPSPPLSLTPTTTPASLSLSLSTPPRLLQRPKSLLLSPFLSRRPRTELDGYDTELAQVGRGGEVGAKRRA
jgi:hypothetical protein